MEPNTGSMQGDERRSTSVEKGTDTSLVDRDSHTGYDEEAQTCDAEEWKISRQEVLILLFLSVMSLIVALDASVIVTALSAIIQDVDGTATQGFWIGTAYLLACTVIMPPMASVSEIFGRPICLMFSLVMFSLGAVLCCVAHTINMLLVGRAIQGIGGGGIWIVCYLLLTDIVPLRQRPKWWTVISLGWAVGLVIGPLIGGAIGEHTTWRWVFYLNFPFCAVGLVLVPLLLTLKPRVESVQQKLARVDWIGGFLFTTSLTAFLFGLTAGGTVFPWASDKVLAPLIIGFIGLVATFIWEEHGPKEPMLRRSLFYNRTSNITYLGGFFQGLVMYGQLYYVPFYALSVKQTSPVRAGVILLPVMLILIPSGAVAGVLISRFNSYRPTIWVGWAFIALSSGLQLLWDANVSEAVWIITLIILGLGHGFVLNAQTFACQAVAKPGDIGMAAATYGFVRQFGTAVGVSVGSTTFQNVMALKLRWQNQPTQIAYNAEGYIPDLLALPDGDTTKTEILDAYVFGFRGVWEVFLAIAGLTFFLTLLIRHYDMNKAIESEHKLVNSRVSKIWGSSNQTSSA
ncbi:major facilitator superfamily transporter [Xylariales sp. PMI_506]|nr:major facilitator superfamily transporter [Xylariales sp. PMI_506]